MQVSKLPVSFKAQTKINSSEYMLRKEDVQYFEARGKDIGKQSDIIEINIGDKKANKLNPSQDVYIIKTRTEFDGIKQKATTLVPVEKLTPKKYLNKFFEMLEQSEKTNNIN